MPRVLGLDVGHKRIGVAVSDETRLIARSAGCIDAAVRPVAALRELLEKYATRELVVGLPLNMNGTESEQTQRVRTFVEGLQKNVPEAQVSFWDERLSTRAGERMLIGADISRKRRKEVIDGLAAQWILQGYLDRQRNELAASPSPLKPPA